MAGESLLSWITSVADRGRELLDRSATSQALSAPSLDSLKALCAELLSRRGEATGVALAREVVSQWNRLSPDEQLPFFETLVDDYSADRGALHTAIKEYKNAPSEEALIALNRATEPTRQELLRRINIAPGGTYAIVKMRQAVIEHLRDNPRLGSLDADMTHLLTSWFNRGFLELRRIDWDTAASLLEKLIQYEAVHEINGWEDLRRRLAPDRRCFAFFHPTIAGEPLIFVEVALSKGIPAKVQSMLDSPVHTSMSEIFDTATFYSISNCQSGLRGISFGNFLIKQVVEDLQHELPNLKNFVTLSPIPGFVQWLEAISAKEKDDAPSDLAASVCKHLNTGWHRKIETAKPLEEPILRLCAWYLLKARDQGLPVDPVARFHLSNGAQIERLNWLGDISNKGLRHSAGLTVNYLYRTDRIVRNHEAFSDAGTIAASRAIRNLASFPRKASLAAIAGRST